jgi:putative transcriptional regulator
MRRLARCCLLALLLLSAGPLTAARRSLGPAPSVAGMLLVAEERLSDPNFDHGVVLMVHHDAQGAMGLVVNRRYGRVPLPELLRGLGREPGTVTGEIDLYYGGPVEPHLGFVLHGPGYATPATRRVTPGLSMTGDPQAVADLAESRVPGPAKLLLGYAGWAPGQLENEMLRRDWLTVPADADLVLSAEAEEIWRQAFARRGTDL